LKDFTPVIKKAPIFSGIGEDELSSMLACLDAKTSEYGRGEYILRAGDRAEAVGLLLSGSALVLQEDFWGNRNIISRVAPGQTFAEAFACSPGAALSVSVAADEACAVMWLNVARILSTCPTACAHHSRMIRNLLSDLAGKNLRFSEKLTHMGQRTTREKLMSYLSAEAQRAGSPEFDIPFSRQQLADYLSVERSAMSAELGRLRGDGVLKFDKNHFALRLAGEGRRKR
jgi:CRP/FNR family cyclic AMP-dependent transcriptional regulator